MARPLLTVEDVGRRLHLSRASVYRLIDAGELVRIKVGGSARFRAEDVERLIEQGAQQTRRRDWERTP